MSKTPYRNLELGLPKFLVVDTEEDGKDHILIRVRPKDPTPICPHCVSFLVGPHQFNERDVRDLKLFGKTTTLIIHERRYRCSTCGKTFNLDYQSVDRDSKMTKRLIDQICVESLDAPFTKVGESYGVSDQTVRNHFMKYVERHEEERQLLTPEKLAIDGVWIVNTCSDSFYKEQACLYSTGVL